MKQGIAKVVCKCEHEYQDKHYGKNTRIANSTAKQDNNRVEVRCTVCKATHTVNSEQVK